MCVCVLHSYMYFRPFNEFSNLACTIIFKDKVRIIWYEICHTYMYIHEYLNYIRCACQKESKIMVRITFIELRGQNTAQVCLITEIIFWVMFLCQPDCFISACTAITYIAHTFSYITRIVIIKNDYNVLRMGRFSLDLVSLLNLIWTIPYRLFNGEIWYK